MRQLAHAFLLAFLLSAVAPVPARAQKLPRPVPAGSQKLPPRVPARAPKPPWFTIAVNGGYQLTTTGFDDSFTFTLHQETGTSRTSYPINAGPLIDGGIAVRLWGGLRAGVAVSSFVVDGTVSATSSVPHPFFLQRHRTVSGEADRMRREETTLHVQAQYQLPAFGRLHIVLAGGPSLLDIKQSIVTNVKFAEEYPYDVATFAAVDSRRVYGTGTGFNVGADVRWMFTRHAGAGALVRFTHAPIDLDVAGRTIRVDAGGSQIGVGLRLAF